MPKYDPMIDGDRLRIVGGVLALGGKAARLIDKIRMTQDLECCPKEIGLQYLDYWFSNSTPRKQVSGEEYQCFDLQFYKINLKRMLELKVLTKWRPATE